MKAKQATSFILIFLVAGVTSSAIPIWELLTYQEKMGRLLYIFVHLVERYCKTTPMADCRKTMTLHGVSNLLNQDDHSLDLLDPDQRNGSRLLWQAAVKSHYKYPVEKNSDTTDQKPFVLPFGFQESKQLMPRIALPPPKFIFRRDFWNP